MITVGEQCFELSRPLWQPPAEDGLVALVDADSPAVWADRLLARHGDGFAVWAATGAQPARRALAVAHLPEARAVTIAPAGVDARQAGLVLEYACHVAAVRVDRPGPRPCVMSPAPPDLPPAAVRIPHLVAVRRGGEAMDAVVWELMPRAQAHGWLGGPLPDQRFFESHLASLLELRAAARARQLPLSAAGWRLAELLYTCHLSIRLVYQYPELFHSLITDHLGRRRP